PGQHLLDRACAERIVLIAEEGFERRPALLADHDAQGLAALDDAIPADRRDPLHLVAPGVPEIPEVQHGASRKPRLPCRLGRGDDVQRISTSRAAIPIDAEVPDDQALRYRRWALLRDEYLVAEAGQLREVNRAQSQLVHGRLTHEPGGPARRARFSTFESAPRRAGAAGARVGPAHRSSR